MKKGYNLFLRGFDKIWNKIGFGMRTKLIMTFLIVKVIPLVLVTIIAFSQIVTLGDVLKDISITDASSALNDSAVENIERMSTDTALRVADFLYGRDADILYISKITPNLQNYLQFIDNKTGRLVNTGDWELASDGKSWVPAGAQTHDKSGGVSTNSENNDQNGFHYRHSEDYDYINVPLYDEITFIGLDGQEIIKVVAAASAKKNYPLDPDRKNVSLKENTYVKAETYFEELKKLKPGEIYVSDVIGAYVGSNYIGMYTPGTVAAAAETRGYDIEYNPESQAYAGKENPVGDRFEGIIRWGTPVTNAIGEIIGYVTFALNHDHIMEFVDHQTPMNERYTELTSAFEGNYAFIWDYKCRSICHPRHHSIVGYDPETGDEQVPWLEASIYNAWQESGIEKWTDFIKDWPTFDAQSRSKTPAPTLTKQGLVGLDGRYLNNAPQCTGWMDLTQDGGSGSFYILWSGLYKLTTAAAIPYYTGQYAPSEANGFSQRGFGFVAIGAGLDDFIHPAVIIEEKLTEAIGDRLRNTITQLIITVALLIALVVLIAIMLASFITENITKLIKGISRFRAGERQFRFKAPVKDEFGALADSFDAMADNITNSVNSPLCITDLNRRIIYMNEQGLEICRMTLPEIVGTYYSESSVYPTGTKYCPITALEEGHESEAYFLEEANSYVKGTANYFLDEDGNKIGYIILSTDVTEMSLERMKIEEQKSLLDKIFSASPDLIWYKDAQGRYLAVNPRFSAVAGKSDEEFTGKTAEEMLPSEIAGDFIENDAKAIKSKVTMYSEERIEFADGHDEMLDSVRTPIFDANGAFVGLLGFARNVSARVEIENELRHTQIDLEQAVNDANRANEHKGEFLARMSHEIRTPMNVIIGMTNIIKRRLDEGTGDGSGVEAVKGNIKQIEISSQHLLGLLNDILDISKIEAGKIDLSYETVDLTKLESTVVSIIKPRCDEKNITFGTYFEALTMPTFNCDALRLRQVLINLLGNAVKFTPENGRVEFRVEVMERGEDKSLIKFIVRDTGIGISDEAMLAIFQPFEQANSKISRQYGGTGLGLAISRRIVQLFGGDIAVISKEGEGSEFSFSIWLNEVESDAPAIEAIEDITGKFADKKALLVDDVDINRMIVSSLLEVTGIAIDEACNGQEAFKKFEGSAENEYDIILMDVQMPIMDGYEASSQIRALPRQDARQVPIVALTANAFKDDIDKALRHGMNAHIAKPIEMEKLTEILFRFLFR